MRTPSPHLFVVRASARIPAPRRYGLKPALRTGKYGLIERHESPYASRRTPYTLPASRGRRGRLEPWMMLASQTVRAFFRDRAGRPARGGPGAADAPVNRDITGGSFAEHRTNDCPVHLPVHSAIHRADFGAEHRARDRHRAGRRAVFARGRGRPGGAGGRGPAGGRVAVGGRRGHRAGGRPAAGGRAGRRCAGRGDQPARPVAEPRGAAAQEEGWAPIADTLGAWRKQLSAWAGSARTGLPAVRPARRNVAADAGGGLGHAGARRRCVAAGGSDRRRRFGGPMTGSSSGGARC